jgi:tryptophanase
MFGGDTEAGEAPALELVRLAMPRRVYTQSHVDRILEICAEVASRKEALRGVEIAWAPPFLRHFTARFRPL